MIPDKAFWARCIFIERAYQCFYLPAKHSPPGRALEWRQMADVGKLETTGELDNFEVRKKM